MTSPQMKKKSGDYSLGNNIYIKTFWLDSHALNHFFLFLYFYLLNRSDIES